MIQLLEPYHRAPRAPKSIERDGKTYRLRTISAYAVREGDLVRMVDGTNDRDPCARVSYGEVFTVTKFTARQSPTPWNRVELVIRDWRGSVRWYSLTDSVWRQAPKDRMNVWRTA
jgi:hypothetical protein